MTRVLALTDLKVSPTAALFEGRDDIPVSFFVTTPSPGGGPVLHTHPYAEVFLVQEGEATFTAGDEQVVASAGHVVIVPPETPHRFENTGAGALSVFSVHPSPQVQQTDLE